MNYIIFILIFSFFASGCSQNSEKFDRNNSVYTRADTLCFERYSGAKNQDTAFISLIINGNQVNGSYSNYPLEKDARIGIIKGSKAGNDITGTWYYTQEGIADSVAFYFSLKENYLMQKQSNFDLKTGREYLADTAVLKLKYMKIQCLKSRNRFKT